MLKGSPVNLLREGLSYHEMLSLGELLALRWSDVNLEDGQLIVRRSLSRVKVFEASETKTTLIFQEPKTKSGRRIIPLPSSIVKILKEYQQVQEGEKSFAGKAYEDNGLVFCTELGKPIEPRNMMRRFYNLVEQAQIEKINFHALRHTFETRAIENGMNLKVLQEILARDTGTFLNNDDNGHLFSCDAGF